MIDVILELLKTLLYVIWNFGLTIGKTIYQLSGIPTTQYGLVKFIVENNVVIFNSLTITKLIMFIVPLIVSHVLVYICDLFRIRAFKEKEALSIILYIVILYVFSLWQFWIIFGIVIMLIVAILIISNNRNEDEIN